MAGSAADLMGTQIRELRRRPSRKYIRTSEYEGREFPYLEDWHAIAEANRIFGCDAWNRKTVWFECVCGLAPMTGPVRPQHGQEFSFARHRRQSTLYQTESARRRP